MFSAVFANVISLDTTALNATVPAGLWAVPSLSDIPNLSFGDLSNLTSAGRRRRSLEDNLLDDDEDYKGQFGDGASGGVMGTILKSVATLALIDTSPECQALPGCRLYNVKYLLGVQKHLVNFSGL